MATKQLTVTAEEIQAWKTGKQDTIVSGTNATGTGNVVLAASPTLTGIPVVPTASVGTNTTQAANAAYVKAEIVATTPSTVDISAVDAPTAAINTKSGQLATTMFVAENSKLLMDLNYLGFVGTLLPVGTTLGSLGSNETLISQRVRMSTFIVYETITVTGVKFNMNNAGVYTASNTNGICLYSVSGTTYTKFTGGEILNATMWTTVDLNTVTFTTPLSLTPGEYGLSFMYSRSAETTAPVISSFCSVHNGTSKFLANTRSLQCRIDTQTAFTNTLLTTSMPSVNSIAMMWLY
jgi:hypothetical protein